MYGWSLERFKNNRYQTFIKWVTNDKHYLYIIPKAICIKYCDVSSRRATVHKHNWYNIMHERVYRVKLNHMK